MVLDEIYTRIEDHLQKTGRRPDELRITEEEARSLAAEYMANGYGYATVENMLGNIRSGRSFVWGVPLRLADEA